MDSIKFDFAVIGNVGIDTNIYLTGSEIDFSIEANFTENLDYVGQAGGYTSRGYAQLGYKAAFIGFIGDDFNGKYILDQFAQDNINSDAMFMDPGGTSRSINFMYPDGRRKNFYDGKNRMHLEPDFDKCQDILSKSKFAHFHIPNWARNLLPIAKEFGLIVSCDLQDIVNIEDPYRQDFIHSSDILFFSSVNHDEPEHIIRHVLNLYPDKIIISGMGAQGCALGTKDGIQYFNPVKMEMPVIDTNGAGDGLAVGFLSSYLSEGYNLNESIQRGQIAARYTCTQKASTSSLITREQMDEHFKEK